MIMARIRTYSELSRIEAFDDRFDYLKLGGSVGRSTFGFDRHVNQAFYHSTEWRSARQYVILRDNACDLGVPGYEINGGILVHHINPMEVGNLVHNEEWVLDPEYLITTTQDTHNAIHFGDKSLLRRMPVERQRGDTKLW
jgi:hypothetical protein